MVYIPYELIIIVIAALFIIPCGLFYFIYQDPPEKTPQKAIKDEQNKADEKVSCQTLTPKINQFNHMPKRNNQTQQEILLSAKISLTIMLLFLIFFSLWLCSSFFL